MATKTGTKITKNKLTVTLDDEYIEALGEMIVAYAQQHHKDHHHYPSVPDVLYHLWTEETPYEHGITGLAVLYERGLIEIFKGPHPVPDLYVAPRDEPWLP
jgi:hypothetical protein